MGLLTLFLVLLISSSCNVNKNTEIDNYYRATYIIPEKVNPLNSFSTVENSICEITLEGLFSVNNFLEYEPVLVSNWSLDKSGTIYNFEIKKDVKFHNGIGLTSKIVKKSLERLLVKSSPVYNRYKRVKKITVVGKYSFKIELDKAFPPFLALLSAPAAKIYLKNKNAYPIGTGAFYYSTHDKEEAKFKRFENYHSKKPQIKNLHYVKVGEKELRKRIASGEIHDSSLLPYVSNIKVENKSIFRKVEVPAASTWIVAFNTSKGVTKSLELRRCLVDSLSKKDFIMKFVPDHSPAEGFLPPTLYNKKIEQKMRGSCNKKFSHKLVVDIPKELEKSSEICHFFKESFDTTGVTTSCNIVAFDKLVKSIKAKKSDAHFLAQTLDLPYVEYFLETFQDGSLINLSNYSSKSYNENLEKLRQTSDRAQRLRYIERLNNELFENAVTLNISYPKQKSYWHKCLEGYSMPLPGEAYIDYKSIRLVKSCNRIEDFL